MVKMSPHQPYEAWLFSEEPLTLDQRQALQAHLAHCPECQQLSEAWSQVDDLFRRVPLELPAAGFTARWQNRLAAQQSEVLRQHYRRQSWWTFAIAAGLAAASLGLLLYHAFTSHSPTYFVFVLAYQVAAVLSFLGTVQELVPVLLKTIGSLVPPIYWAAAASGMALLSALWIASLRKLFGTGS